MNTMMTTRQKNVLMLRAISQRKRNQSTPALTYSFQFPIGPIHQRGVSSQGMLLMKRQVELRNQTDSGRETRVSRYQWLQP